MGTWLRRPYLRASVFTLWSPRASLWTRESFSTYVMLRLLRRGMLSIAKLILSISFAKELLAAPMSKCPQILEFGSSKEKKSTRYELPHINFIMLLLIEIEFFSHIVLMPLQSCPTKLSCKKLNTSLAHYWTVFLQKTSSIYSLTFTWNITQKATFPFLL